ncbi:phospho-N-acetylmuramoyl-pentapeptide-transferase [Vulcanibacillus modesticaldus]|uniref:Phospho-N-acetylmuramoyl-pentapeptide-transferase n=1 Tax=Vulcanibacillus modesticaldus TaxID=337097 RepID=A0A1D2YUY7_9BACI|nr:phospho-N-acetylmuramoyl-pentapeptide-transferase [Vulcanibacillus modesticaldus]OEF99524.1 phospho-N-acetylmuramoyl-pentapeptide-transferase [Vulcanibacillus modesticaldus]
MEIRIIIFTIIAALLISTLLGPLFIPILRKLKFGQSIREEGPKLHQKKAGTPTMGGIIIYFALILTVIKFSPLTPNLYLLLLVTLGFGFLGFLDDFIKIVKKRNLGLTAKQKLFGQLFISSMLYYFLSQNGHDTVVYIPGQSWGIDLGWLYFPFILLLTIGTTNAVNLTDGLDGLLAGSSAISFGAFSIIALKTTQYEVAIFGAAMVGVVLGFLVFNAHPAKVFMGDTGSLGIGGALATMAILTKTELLLIIIGGVYVIETLSVIIQVISFQTRGKRVFRMSPIHHHFELSGWSEWKVVTFFWIIGFIFAGIGIYLEVLN